MASSKKWIIVGFEEILWVSTYKIRQFNGPLWTLCVNHIKNLAKIKKYLVAQKEGFFLSIATSRRKFDPRLPVFSPSWYTEYP